MAAGRLSPKALRSDERCFPSDGQEKASQMPLEYLNGMINDGFKCLLKRVHSARHWRFI